MMFMFQEKIFGVWAIYYMELNNVVKKGMVNYIERLSHHFFIEKLVSIRFYQSTWHRMKCGQKSHMSACLILFVSDGNFEKVER